VKLILGAAKHITNTSSFLTLNDSRARIGASMVKNDSVGLNGVYIDLSRGAAEDQVSPTTCNAHGWFLPAYLTSSHPPL